MLENCTIHWGEPLTDLQGTVPDGLIVFSEHGDFEQMRRFNSHMSNVASGIIYPLNEIDFVRGDILE
ncbi:MAG: hypothetical protein QGI51_01000 [Dehalococcoidales bacterium]|jgi:hypothetical protein|nr:hypothetical protein [Dehalococcoidales bacterium]MDP6632066.1 hypothetical protein [Dehalococcoidales bacterium]|tara:strand:- start:408 stop:608 length:201 start_codon:yes stop_codon:yes gene_type:complete